MGVTAAEGPRATLAGLPEEEEEDGGNCDAQDVQLCRGSSLGTVIVHQLSALAGSAFSATLALFLQGFLTPHGLRLNRCCAHPSEWQGRRGEGVPEGQQVER